MNLNFEAFHLPIIIIYYSLLIFLTIYGIHRYYIIFLYMRHFKYGNRFPFGKYQEPAELPTVAIQLPMFNELYVAERIIQAAGNLDYPKDKLLVQVLDDSTDETREVAQKAVEDLKARGINAEYRHRTNREGFKAGALAEGLKEIDADLVAIFDADFVPPPEFLRRTVPYFQNEKIGLVQTRWGYLNRKYSVLTRVQSIMLDGHFVMEHTARNYSGKFMNFNGTAGIFRRQAILDAGSWSADTLTEDLDLSYRIQMKGWQFLFMPWEVCPSELPVTITGFKNQQHRWTKGSIQVGKKLLPRIFKSNLPFMVKLESVFHLFSPFNYVVLFAFSLFMPLALYFRYGDNNSRLIYLEMLIFVMSVLSISAYYALSQKEGHKSWKRMALYIPMVFSVGIGICITNGKGVLEALLSRQSPFVRTPKYRIEADAKAAGNKSSWRKSKYKSLMSKSTWVEIALAAYMWITLGILVNAEVYAAIPFVLLFVVGYTYVSFLTLRHA